MKEKIIDSSVYRKTYKHHQQKDNAEIPYHVLQDIISLVESCKEAKDRAEGKWSYPDFWLPGMESSVWNPVDTINQLIEIYEFLRDLRREDE